MALAGRLHADGRVVALAAPDWAAMVRDRGYRAIVFDCDGTLVESSDAHLRAFRAAAARQGETMDRDWYLARTGLDRVSLFAAFTDIASTGFDSARAARDSIDLFVADTTGISAIAEVVALVDAAGLSGLPIAVGTNAEANVVDAALRAAGLGGRFGVVISLTEAGTPKPDPTIFRLAFACLGVDPSDGLVLEDSLQGVAAGLSLGCNVLEVVRQDHDECARSNPR